MSPRAWEVPVGAVDGANTLFVTSVPYALNTLAVFLNGQLKHRDFDDGWVETSPSLGQFTLKEAPRPGDVVQVCYMGLDSAGDTPLLVLPLRGTLVGADDLEGRIASVIELRGTLCSC